MNNYAKAFPLSTSLEPLARLLAKPLSSPQFYALQRGLLNFPGVVYSFGWVTGPTWKTFDGVSVL